MDQITYFGLDLGEYYSQVSYYKDAANDVVSVSPRLGSQSYLIPTIVAKRPDIGQWDVGEEALKDPAPIKNILSSAYERRELVIEGNKVPAIDLLLLYIRRVFSYAASVGCDKARDYFIICIDDASLNAVETLLTVTGQLGIQREHVKICSRREAFCYYVMNQEASIHMNDVLLLDYWEDSFKVYQLHQDRTVLPNVIGVEELQISGIEKIHQQDGMTKEEILKHKEAILSQSLDEILGGKLISSVYLVGNGFEGDWMEHSLSRLCAGRRVFSGMNLYTKGTCYYGKMVFGQKGNSPEFLYLGGGNLLYNICVKVYHQQEYYYHVLLPAGYNWQDAQGTMEVILAKDDHPTIEFTCKSLRKGGDKVVSLMLSGLSVSEDKTTRIRIHAQAVAADRVKVMAEQIGFGEVAPAERKSWSMEIRL